MLFRSRQHYYAYSHDPKYFDFRLRLFFVLKIEDVGLGDVEITQDDDHYFRIWLVSRQWGPETTYGSGGTNSSRRGKSLGHWDMTINRSGISGETVLDVPRNAPLLNPCEYWFAMDLDRGPGNRPALWVGLDGNWAFAGDPAEGLNPAAFHGSEYPGDLSPRATHERLEIYNELSFQDQTDTGGDYRVTLISHPGHSDAAGITPPAGFTWIAQAKPFRPTLPVGILGAQADVGDHVDASGGDFIGQILELDVAGDSSELAGSTLYFPPCITPQLSWQSIEIGPGQFNYDNAKVYFEVEFETDDVGIGATVPDEGTTAGTDNYYFLVRIREIGDGGFVGQSFYVKRNPASPYQTRVFRKGITGSESDLDTAGAEPLKNGTRFMFAIAPDDNEIWAGSNGEWFSTGDPEFGTAPTANLRTAGEGPAARNRRIEIRVELLNNAESAAVVAALNWRAKLFTHHMQDGITRNCPAGGFVWIGDLPGNRVYQ